MISNFHIPLPYKVKVREISEEQVEKLLKAEEIIIEKLERLPKKRMKAYLPGLRILGNLIETGKKQAADKATKS